MEGLQYGEEGDDPREVHSLKQMSTDSGRNTEHISLSPTEMAKYWESLNSLRLENSLCDVHFIVKGQVFPAHRVVLSCCSDWLRSVLADEGSNKSTVGAPLEIVLDSLDPVAFSLILNYLYGEPLTFPPYLSPSLLSVIRAFNMDALELRCWRHLIRSVKPSTCLWLHELADIYENGALKYEAWNLCQRVLPYLSAEMDPWDVLAQHIVDADKEEEDWLDEDRDTENGRDSNNTTATEAVESKNRSPFGRRKSDVFPDEHKEETAFDDKDLKDKNEKKSKAREVVIHWAHKLHHAWEKCSPTLTVESETALSLLAGRLPRDFYYDTLVAYYNEHNPDKIYMVDAILDTWEGREDQLLKAVADKYKKLRNDEGGGSSGEEEEEERYSIQGRKANQTYQSSPKRGNNQGRNAGFM